MLQRIKLNKKTLEALYSKKKEERFKVENEKYLFIRIRNNDNKKYYFVKTRDGRRHKEMIGDIRSMHKDLAIKKCNELSTQIDLGKYTKRFDINRFTTKNLCSQYIKDRNLSSFTRRDYTRFLRLLDQHSLSSIPWINLDNDIVSNFYNRIKVGKGTTANYCMRFLHAVGREAMEDHPDIFYKNPILSIKKKKKIRSITVRDVYLKDYQIEKFLIELNKCKSEIAKSYIEFLLLTGLRRSEAINLKWQQIDFKDRTMYFDISKNNESKLIPLSSKSLQILKKLEINKCGEYVFSYLDGAKKSQRYLHPDKTIRNLAKKLDVPIRLHDLRRTFATYMDNLGCPISSIKTLMGQKVYDVTNIHYVRKHKDILLQWLEKYVEYIYADNKIIKVDFQKANTR